ncbi:MAG: DNA polymerase III subunit gamma/tau [Xenococcaceae cyanobacterium MO_167.B52]|nr:DNA polymerase III subunit gamma/tau [Xenococcaceae cyanobacterium MO_167.B52]
MTYEPLHHKYRPQTFGDLVGQSAIAQTLINGIKQEKIAPAYLFTGPRGTGKTSSARILAKSLNCLKQDRPTPTPCGECEVCKAIATGTALDIIEIDAASNTGVDNIREIIERSQFAPVQSRYKVYAIDECHMLSTAAFNALLKTLEEPPPRVVFILATTDPQRVLPTIISRCQRFDYRRIPLEEMVNHLKYIAQQENIDIDSEAIRLVAQVANGGLRDAESLLDQLSLFPEKITIDQVWDLVGAIPERDLLSLLQEIRTKNFAGVLSQCRNLLDRGREPITVLQNLASFYLNLLIAQSAPQSSNLVAVTEDCWTKLKEEAAQWQQETILWGQQKLKEAETQIKNTTQPRLWLEVTLLGLLSESTATSITAPNIPVVHSATQTVVKQNEPSPTVQPKTENQEDSKKEIPQKEQTEKVVPLTPTNSAEIVREPSPINSKVVPITKNQPVTENLATSRSEVDIQTIWQKAIAILEPPTTRSLLKQKCHLISLEDSQAIIGISAPPLLRLLQGKAANIEAAFTQVCQRKIKVTLEIASAQEVGDLNETRRQGGQGDWGNKETRRQGDKEAKETRETRRQGDKETQETKKGAISSDSNEEIIPNTEKHTPTVIPPIAHNQESPKPILNGNHGERAIVSDRKILPQQDSIPPIIEASSKISHPSEYQSDSESSEGDFAKAVELIAQNFDGEIITLDDYFYNTESEDISPPAIESEENLPPEATNDNELPNNQKNTCPSIITNRPDSSQYDDEDVPFAKPINFAAIELKLQDCWELAINEPRKTLLI